jgi:ribosome-binding factor A
LILRTPEPYPAASKRRTSPYVDYNLRLTQVGRFLLLARWRIPDPISSKTVLINAVPARFSITRSGILNRLPEQGGAMPEHRGRKHHQDRVAETLRLEIGAMIEGELSDPRIDFCYVSEVALNPGGKSARVYIAVDSSVKDITKAEANTIAGLEAAKGYIRFELKERMGVRHVPELSFLADRSGRFQARIVELMDRSRKKAAHRASTTDKRDEESKAPTQSKPPSEQGAISS